MAKIKSLDKTATKFATVTPQRSTEYSEGVQNPGTDWATATKAAESSYEQGVQSAMTKKSFGKGVTKAGSEKWKKGATEKGAQRFAAGVAMAGDAYKNGFAPYHSAIERTTLPARYAKRDPRNLDRVKAIVNAVVAVKEKGA